METEVAQLVEMGATRAQARAALARYKDVMQAAERIFDGKFDDVVDGDGDVEMASASEPPEQPRRGARPMTPDGADDEDEDADADDAGEDYEDFDYDSDYEEKITNGGASSSHADPYAGIFFSKDRREEVIEVEEEPETAYVAAADETAALMTQGQWMKGCPEGGEQTFLFSLYQELSAGECRCPHGCGAALARHAHDFFALFAQFGTYTAHLARVVPVACPRCARRFCFACGEPMDAPRARAEDALFHCSNLQGVILGVGLAMLEKTWAEEYQNASGDEGRLRAGMRRKAEPTPAPPVHHHDQFDEDEDEDYPPVAHAQGKKVKLGVGYAGDVREDTSGQLEAQALQRAKDEKLAQLLSRIRVYLPSLHREGGGRTSDYLVHPTALAHLRRRFNFVSSQLLRNDSLTDMSERSVLYIELFEWLETISCHEALASMMAMPIMVATHKETRKSPPRAGSKIRERTIVYEGSSGPRELLEAIVIQAKAALKGLEGPKPEAPVEMTEEEKRKTGGDDDKGKATDIYRTSTEENVRLFSFCQRILGTAKAIDRSLVETKGQAFVDRLHASLPRIPDGSGEAEYVDAGETEQDAIKAYEEWAGRVRFEYCDLTIPPSDTPGQAQDEENPTPHFKFFYNNEARMLANSDIPKRSLAIAKELAVLTTNLPVDWNSSIFMRVDETRVDVIKVLITGPDVTPYHNGCYQFDVFLGAAYNQSPPSVKYMTTNGGKFRFNPNLYADGKVCLSLLGTWSGPGWVSGKSTLLQVLVSIQSMILCDEPYLNEPGWSTMAGTPQSRAYSANVRRMVVRTAMLGNLKNPPEPFGDVIRTHFRLKARSITKQLDQWLTEDDGKPIGDGGYGGASRSAASGSNNGFRADVEEMKRLLTKLQAGESID